MFRLRLLAAAVVTFSTLLIGGGAPVHAAGASALVVQNAIGWCVTPLNNNVGSELVLGRCNPNIAPSQVFYADDVTSNSFMILNNQSGLCITYAYPNGAPDGGYMTQGYCVGAQNQTFQFQNTGLNDGWVYFLRDRRDNNGNVIALDNAGGNLVVDNHIDGSYGCNSCASESWSAITQP